jgi:hypothetical protein
VQSWKLKDDLDLADFGESWLTYPENEGLLKGSELVLLQHIQQSAELWALFLVEDESGAVVFNAKAIDIYEAKVQDFLKRLLILCYVTAGQPLREPEFLSILWRNTSRQRHIMIWERPVMIFT